MQPPITTAPSSLAPKHRSRQGFSLIELLAVIAVVAILAALLIPAVNSVRIRIKHAACASNLRQIGQGFSLFLVDNNGRFPGAGPGGGSGLAKSNTRWLHRIGAYMNLGEPITYQQGEETVVTLPNAYRYPVFHSPFTDPSDYSTGDPSRESFGVYGSNDLITLNTSEGSNAWGLNIMQINNPAQTILCAEHNAGIDGSEESAPFVRLNRSGPYPQYYNGIASNVSIQRHGIPPNGEKATGPANILFADMHIETIDLEDFDPWPDSGSSNTRITFIP